MVATIKELMGPAFFMSKKELKAKKKRYKVIAKRRENSKIIKQLPRRDNRENLTVFLKKIQTKPDFKKELNMMKDILRGGK